MNDLNRLTVTGIHVYLSVTIVFIICIFYTAIVSVGFRITYETNLIS